MQRIKTTRLMLLTAVAATTMMSGAAQAQEQSTTEQATSGLQDIIVTAQKRSENLQNAAIPVSAVDGSTISEAGVTSPAELSKLVPSLQVGTASGAISAYFIRGVGKMAFNSQVDSAVLVNLDGVGLGRSASSNGYFYDLERVEVLKGPQGTLYGRNATGGAINIITRKPSFDAVSGFAEAEYGNFDAFRASGAVNVPLSTNVALRAAGQIVRRDGYLSDGTQDEKSDAARLTAAFRLSDTTKLVVGGDYYHLGGRGPGAVLLPFTDPNNRRIGMLDPRSVARQTAIRVFPAGNTLPAPPTDTFMDVENWGVYAQLDADTDFGTVTLLPAYREAKPRTHTVSSQTVDLDEKSSQLSVEARLTSNGSGPLKYVLGLYYFDEDVHYLGAFNQGFTLSYRDVTLPSKSYAAFARLNYSITPDLRVDGGLRYTYDKKAITTDGYNVRVTCATPFACTGGPSIPTVLGVPSIIFNSSGALIPSQPYGSTGNNLTAAVVKGAGRDTFSDVTYHLGIEYDVAPRSLFYVSYDTGFKAGGFFSTVPQDKTTFDPEKIKAITIGLKNRFLNNTLQLNLEAFHWKYRDQQVSFFSTDSAGGLVFKTDNVGKSTLKGFEVDALFAATPTTTLRSNIQYLDAKNDRFVYRVFSPGGATPNTGCTPTAVGGNFFDINCSGRRPTLTSKWILSFGAEQRLAVGGAGEFVLDIGTRYQSKFNSGFELLPSMVQKGYWTTDASVTFNTADERYYVTAYVRNIENNTPIATSVTATQTSSYTLGYLRAPRTYGIRAGAKF